MHQNTFGGQAPPGPAGELMRSPPPDTLVAMGMGPTSKEGGQKGGEGTEREGKGIPQSQGE